MNLVDAAKLLAAISVVDNRRVDDPAIRVWASIIEDIDLDVAMEAMRRFRRDNPGVWLDPGHIVQYGKQILKEQDTLRVKARALRMGPDTYTRFIGGQQAKAIDHAWKEAHSPELVTQGIEQ